MKSFRQNRNTNVRQIFPSLIFVRGFARILKDYKSICILLSGSTIFCWIICQLKVWQVVLTQNYSYILSLKRVTQENLKWIFVFRSGVFLNIWKILEICLSVPQNDQMSDIYGVSSEAIFRNAFAIFEL